MLPSEPAVAAGIPLEELKSFGDLLRADHVEILMEYYWEKNGEKPSLYTIDLASKLLALARCEAVSEVEIERLDEIRIALKQYRSTGLTEKTQAHPPDRPERYLARGHSTPAKAHGSG